MNRATCEIQFTGGPARAIGSGSVVSYGQAGEDDSWALESGGTGAI